MAAGLAFAGAVAVAWLVTSVRPTVGSVEREQYPPNWPIMFTLPAEYSWTADRGTPASETDLDRSFGITSYLGRSLVLGGSVAVISYLKLPVGTSAEEAAAEVLPRDLEGRRPIRVGPLTGQMVQTVRRTGEKESFAVACQPSGLAVVVRFSSRAPADRQERIFKSLCQSIVFID